MGSDLVIVLQVQEVRRVDLEIYNSKFIGVIIL